MRRASALSGDCHRNFSSLRQAPAAAAVPLRMSAAAPLLIAVTGGVGSGKSSTLKALADALNGSRRVDGFIAHAGPREEGATRGAKFYDLELLGGATLRFAERDLSQQPPYRFDPAATAALDQWAAALKQPDVLMLDEFGRLEIDGGGQFKRWDTFLASGPAAIVIAVREEHRLTIQTRIGRTFDAHIRSDDPRAVTGRHRRLRAAPLTRVTSWTSRDVDASFKGLGAAAALPGIVSECGISLIEFSR